MIARLRFDPAPPGGVADVARAMHFVARSTLPLSAVCLVANGVREHVGRLLAGDVEVEAGEPALPAARARTLLCDGGFAYRVRGRICQAFVILRAGDARRLAAAAFGEIESTREQLSEIERATIDRLAAAIVPLCAPLCGHIRGYECVAPPSITAEIATYFEVRLSGSVRASVGFALGADPAEEVSPALALEDLADVELPCTVELGSALLEVGAFAALRCGDVLPLDTGRHSPGTLRIDGIALASGICGTSNGRAAFALA